MIIWKRDFISNFFFLKKVLRTIMIELFCCGTCLKVGRVWMVEYGRGSKNPRLFSLVFSIFLHNFFSQAAFPNFLQFTQNNFPRNFESFSHANPFNFNSFSLASLPERTNPRFVINWCYTTHIFHILLPQNHFFLFAFLIITRANSIRIQDFTKNYTKNLHIFSFVPVS